MRSACCWNERLTSEAESERSGSISGVHSTTSRSRLRERSSRRRHDAGLGHHPQGPCLRIHGPGGGTAGFMAAAPVDDDASKLLDDDDVGGDMELTSWERERLQKHVDVARGWRERAERAEAELVAARLKNSGGGGRRQPQQQPLAQQRRRRRSDETAGGSTLGQLSDDDLRRLLRWGGASAKGGRGAMLRRLEAAVSDDTATAVETAASVDVAEVGGGSPVMASSARRRRREPPPVDAATLLDPFSSWSHTLHSSSASTTLGRGASNDVTTTG
jgi:hypothetical protein